MIGRESADVALSDSEVSRRHAVLRPVADGVEVEDLGSLNGMEFLLDHDGNLSFMEMNAPEDPDRDFAPAAGTLDAYVPLGGPWTRVDSHCYPGWTIAPFYDSLIAKLIVWAPDRAAAIERMDRALSEFQIEGRGVKTTIPFHRTVLADDQFRSGDVTTDYLEELSERQAKAAAA